MKVDLHLIRILAFWMIISFPITILGVSVLSNPVLNRTGNYGETDIETRLRDILTNSEFSQYAADKFPGAVLGVVDDKAVMIGKDGWLFYVSEKVEGGNSIGSYQGLAPLSEPELNKIVSNIMHVNQMVKSYGGKLVILIAPDKHTIYPEYLPDNLYRYSHITRMDQLLAKIPDKSVIIDVRKKLVESKSFGPLYYRTDTHWNKLGALVSTSELLQSLGTGSIMQKFDTSNIEKRPLGDLASQKISEEKFSDFEVVLTPIGDVNIPEITQPSTDSRDNLDQRWGKIEDQNSVLVEGDSFSEQMIDFISLAYPGGIYRLHTGTLSVNTSLDNSKIINELKPKVVIWEVVERNLQLLGE